MGFGLQSQSNGSCLNILSIQLLTYWPCDLDLSPSTPKPHHFMDIPMSFSISSLNTSGSFTFELCCGQTDKQTNKQTQVNILPTPTDSVSVGNNVFHNDIMNSRALRKLIFDYRAIVAIFQQNQWNQPRMFQSYSKPVLESCDLVGSVLHSAVGWDHWIPVL